MQGLLKIAASFVFLWIISPSFSFADGTISGTIRNSAGLGISGATVSLIRPSGTQIVATTTTSFNGSYSFGAL